MKDNSIPPDVGRALYQEAQSKKQGGKSATKFSAERTITEHGAFDSRHEAGWVARLNWAVQGGYIEHLVTEKRGLLFALDVNGYRVADYEADARFVCVKSFELPTLSGIRVLLEGHQYVIDAKSKPVRSKTDYRMKKTLMRALYGVEILEV